MSTQEIKATMSRVLGSAALALLSATSATAAVVADKITKLPGWSGELPSPQYSGYLDAGECVSPSQLLTRVRVSHGALHVPSPCHSHRQMMRSYGHATVQLFIVLAMCELRGFDALPCFRACSGLKQTASCSTHMHD
jgi:hypothetical protein